MDQGFRTLALRAKKKSDIEAILKNEVYMPDAGMIQRLRKALDRLPAGDIANLALVVSCKNQPDPDEIIAPLSAPKNNQEIL